MSIASEIARLQQAKADLKAAINSKGGNITTEKIDQFAGEVAALPSPKEEETRTLIPDFSSGDQVITPASGKVLSQVTLTKPADLLPENIAKDKNVCGVVGTSFVAMKLTQAQYDALSTKDSNTYYLIVDAELTYVLRMYKGSELIYEKGGLSDPTIVVIFKSDRPRTITPKFTQSGVTLQYSIDKGSTWNNISSGGTTASSDEIWFRGCATGAKSLYVYTVFPGSNAWAFSGDASNKLRVYGDLRYLLCDSLGDSTIAFDIDSYCFSMMFYGCTALIVAPRLPATTLADYCYSNMFYGCTSLTIAPSLPATTLATGCYANMFRGCTSLTAAPSLPATTLASGCYSTMFYGCTSLTIAPSLPATTLAFQCYSAMFQGCTAFKVSETETGSYQYAWRIPTSGTGTTALDWNKSMLANTGGTFTSDPAINTTYYLENPPV